MFELFDHNQLNIHNECGETCLHTSSAFNQATIVNWLLFQRNINLKCYDFENHWNALHYALKNGNLNVAKSLLEYVDNYSRYNNKYDSNTNNSIDIAKYCLDYNGWNPYDLLPSKLKNLEMYYPRKDRMKLYKTSYLKLLVCQQQNIHTIYYVLVISHFFIAMFFNGV